MKVLFCAALLATAPMTVMAEGDSESKYSTPNLIERCAAAPSIESDGLVPSREHFIAQARASAEIAFAAQTATEDGFALENCAPETTETAARSRLEAKVASIVAADMSQNLALN